MTSKSNMKFEYCKTQAELDCLVTQACGILGVVQREKKRSRSERSLLVSCRLVARTWINGIEDTAQVAEHNTRVTMPTPVFRVLRELAWVNKTSKWHWITQ